MSAVLSIAVSVQAVVPVTEASARSSSSTSPGQEQLGILFSQLQTLQQEIAQLRGQVEEQQHELERLKQQQKDNYMDVDRRLSELHQQAAATPPAAAYGAPLAPAAANEQDSYDRAYALLDKNQKEEAALAFRKHILLYPQGELTPNAYYWLGQIYLSQAQLLDAEEQLSTLLKQYPQHHKAVDAKFALGKVYYQQGKKAVAKKLIQEVAVSDSPTAAPLAKKYLLDNF